MSINIYFLIFLSIDQIPESYDLAQAQAAATKEAVHAEGKGAATQSNEHQCSRLGETH